MAKNPQFSPVIKDRLFYNRFKYCISFNLEELSCLKILDHDYIDTIINRRREWRTIQQQRMYRISKPGIPTIHTILGRRLREITEETISNLHQLTDQLLQFKDEYKLVTSVDHGWIYTNSLKVIKDLHNNKILKNRYCTEAVINRPTNTIKLKNSAYKQRSYFKLLKLTSQEKINIQNFFKNQQNSIRPSKALIEWFDNDYYRTQDYFFVDHNGESWIVMLSLIHSGLIRKTVDIIQG